MTELNKTSNRKNYFWGLGRPTLSPRRLAKSTSLLPGKAGRQAADSHELSCSAGFERSTRSGGGKATSGAEALIKGASGLMRDDLCKQCRVRGEWSGNILCD